jgi:DNA-binding response OmpR family regulator
VLGATYGCSVIVVDSDHTARKRLVDGLAARGFGAGGAASGLAGVEQALHEACDAVVAALPLPDLSVGQFLTMLRAVREGWPRYWMQEPTMPWKAGRWWRR